MKSHISKKKLNLYMNKAVVFILFLIFGVFIFIVSLSNYNALSLGIFFMVYAILTGLIIKKYSKKKLIALIVLSISYIFIMANPSVICHDVESDGHITIKTDCTCIGLEKYDSTKFAGPIPVECLGFIKEIKTTCYEFVPHEFQGYTGYDKEVACK